MTNLVDNTEVVNIWVLLFGNKQCTQLGKTPIKRIIQLDYDREMISGGGQTVDEE